MAIPFTAHHTFIIEGGLERVRAVLQPLGYGEALARGDVWEWEGERLTIAVVREGQRLAHLQGSGQRRFVVWVAKRELGHEAQQALLKLAEEPPCAVVVALGVPAASLCIPTLRSRAVIVRRTSVGEPRWEEEVGRWLKRSLSDRLEYAAKLARTPTDATAFLHALARDASVPFPLRRRAGECVMWARGSGVHWRAILEHLALMAESLRAGAVHCYTTRDG